MSYNFLQNRITGKLTLTLVSAGLWAFNGTFFYPLNLDANSFRHTLYDSQHQKYYFVANIADNAQLFVHDPLDSSKSSLKLTDYGHNCTLDCFSYINVLNSYDGTVVFVYADQLGFTNGTVAGTNLWAIHPQVNMVKGVINNRLYFLGVLTNTSLWTELLATDGTQEGTKKISERVPVGVFEEFDGTLMNSTHSTLRVFLFQQTNF